MDLNGNNKTRLNENASGFEAVTDKYILYNMSEFVDGEETTVSYIMDRDGKNARQINGSRIYTPIIYDNSIYYLTQDRYLHKMDLDGKNDVMLSDIKIYNLNISNNGIYYLNEVYSMGGDSQGISIFRMDLDGKNNEQIFNLQEDSNALCLSKDWVFFLDSNENSGYMELISPDGKQKIDLFKLNYSDYYYLDDLVKEQEGQENTETTPEQTE